MTTTEEAIVIARCKEKYIPGVVINNSNLVKCRMRPEVTVNSTFEIRFGECFIYKTNKEGSFTVWTQKKGFANIVEKTNDISIKKNKINKKLLLLC